MIAPRSTRAQVQADLAGHDPLHVEDVGDQLFLALRVADDRVDGGLPPFVRAARGSRSMCAQPRIALSGVRSSCDSVARNSSFTRPASSASARAHARLFGLALRASRTARALSSASVGPRRDRFDESDVGAAVRRPAGAPERERAEHLAVAQQRADDAAPRAESFERGFEAGPIDVGERPVSERRCRRGFAASRIISAYCGLRDGDIRMLGEPPDERLRLSAQTCA